MDEILKRLEIIEKHVLDQNLILKNVLNFNEAAIFIEVSHSHLYKLTSSGKIPFYKPNGKKIYFNRVELEEWLLRNRNETDAEIEQKAADYLIKKRESKAMSEIIDLILKLSQEIKWLKVYLSQLQKSRLEHFKEAWIDGQEVMLSLNISKRTLTNLARQWNTPLQQNQWEVLL
jgi:excisionase family DNA binding protein